MNNRQNDEEPHYFKTNLDEGLLGQQVWLNHMTRPRKILQSFSKNSQEMTTTLNCFLLYPR